MWNLKRHPVLISLLALVVFTGGATAGCNVATSKARHPVDPNDQALKIAKVEADRLPSPPGGAYDKTLEHTVCSESGNIRPYVQRIYTFNGLSREPLAQYEQLLASEHWTKVEANSPPNQPSFASFEKTLFDGRSATTTLIVDGTDVTVNGFPGDPENSITVTVAVDARGTASECPDWLSF